MRKTERVLTKNYCFVVKCQFQEIPQDIVIYLVYLFRARIDCVKRPCSSLGRLRRYNFVKLHYITLHITLNNASD